MKASALLLFCLAAPVCAQQATPAAPPPVYGQVSGRVFCQDTGLPGRFAGVQLLAEQPSQAPLIDPSTLGKNPDLSKILAAALSVAMKGSNLSTVTGIDGTFSLAKVPPGTYYVIPQLPGYRSPVSGFSARELMKSDAATLTAVEAAAQKIVVQPGAQTSVTVEMERGATLSGTIRYDDGSAAPGVTPTLMIQDKDGKWKELGTPGSLATVTDDRGQFRFYGLAAGEYAVKATLPVTQALIGVGPHSLSMHMNMGDALVVYSGGAVRERDIKPIEVGDGEQHAGVEVTFPVNGLHVISGSVSAKLDNHAVNAGTVELQDPGTKATIRMTMIGEDGTFHFNYVPEGSYLVKVTNAADTESRPGADAGGGLLGQMMNSKVTREYGTAEMQISVTGDVNGLSLQVPDAGAGSGAGEQ